MRSLGKALETARKSLSGDNPEWDMHGYRRTAVSALANAGVAAHAMNLAVGHSNNDDLAVSTFAKKTDLDELLKAPLTIFWGGN